METQVEWMKTDCEWVENQVEWMKINNEWMEPQLDGQKPTGSGPISKFEGVA